jgi:hypothetical protein
MALLGENYNDFVRFFGFCASNACSSVHLVGGFAARRSLREAHPFCILHFAFWICLGLLGPILRATHES